MAVITYDPQAASAGGTDAGVALQSAQTGNADSTNPADRGRLTGPAAIVVTSTIGATPTVTVNIVDAALNDGDNSSSVTFTFSEVTTNFALGDVTATGGTLSAFSGSGTSYSATFTATDGVETTGSVTVTAGSYTDAAGNLGPGFLDRLDQTGAFFERGRIVLQIGLG